MTASVTFGSSFDTVSGLPAPWGGLFACELWRCCSLARRSFGRFSSTCMVSETGKSLGVEGPDSGTVDGEWQRDAIDKDGDSDAARLVISCFESSGAQLP